MMVSLCPLSLRSSITTTLEITEQKIANLVACSILFCVQSQTARKFFHSKFASDRHNECSTCRPCTCTHASFRSLSPFVDSGVNDDLPQTIPDVNNAPLQFIDIVEAMLVHTFLHGAPDVVVDRVIIYK